MTKFLLRDFRAYSTFFIIMMIVMILYSYLTLMVDAVDGLVGFLIIYLPAVSGAILFLGDSSLIPHIAALPVSRRELVIGKYFSTYFFGFWMVFIVILITWIISLFDPKASLDLINLLSLKGFLFAITPIILIVSISYPILFKYGLSIGVRIVLSVLAVTYGFGLIAVEDFLKASLDLKRRGLFPVGIAAIEKVEASFGSWIYLAYIMALLIILTLSISLSIRWINRKDFN